MVTSDGGRALYIAYSFLMIPIVTLLISLIYETLFDRVKDITEGDITQRHWYGRLRNSSRVMRKTKKKANEDVSKPGIPEFEKQRPESPAVEEQLIEGRVIHQVGEMVEREEQKILKKKNRVTAQGEQPPSLVDTPEEIDVKPNLSLADVERAFRAEEGEDV